MDDSDQTDPGSGERLRVVIKLPYFKHEGASEETHEQAWHRRMDERRAISANRERVLQETPSWLADNLLDDLAGAIGRMRSWQEQREAEQPDWAMLRAGGKAMDGAVRELIRRKEIDHPGVREYAAARRSLADTGVVRDLRNEPSGVREKLFGGMAKARTQADLWLLLRLPEPPAEGKPVKLVALRRSLLKLLEQEEWSDPVWGLPEAEAAELKKRIAKRLKASAENLRQWLVAVGWHSPPPRKPRKRLTSKSVIPG